jgi:uncharacterized membrane protein AbrB (regulator of aidB expression)
MIHNGSYPKEDMMMRYLRLMAVLSFIVLAAGTIVGSTPAQAASGAEIDRDVKTALKKLYAESPAARTLGEKAKGILVFPGSLLHEQGKRYWTLVQ